MNNREMESKESLIIKSVWRILIITAIPLWGFFAIKTFLLFDLYKNSRGMSNDSNMEFVDFFIAADCLFLAALAGLSVSTMFFVARLKRSMDPGVQG